MNGFTSTHIIVGELKDKELKMEGKLSEFYKKLNFRFIRPFKKLQKVCLLANAKELKWRKLCVYVRMSRRKVGNPI